MNMKRLGMMIRLKLICILMFSVINISGYSQQGLTLEQALSTAEMNSPSMKRTRLNLIRSQENLNAQNAALKSQFSLMLNPFAYTQSREFNNLISDYNTYTATESYGSFSVSQPIVLTDARIAITNKFGYKDSYSEYSGTTTTGFNNNLSISFDQPLFTYNRTKLSLKELELALKIPSLIMPSSSWLLKGRLHRLSTMFFNNSKVLIYLNRLIRTCKRAMR